MANCEFAHGHVTRGKYPVSSEKPTIFEVVREPGNACLCGFQDISFFYLSKNNFFKSFIISIYIAELFFI